MVRKCKNCMYRELVVKSGDLFTILDPHGKEITKTHDDNIYICRGMPPISGSWAQVTEEDWCRLFEPDENNEDLS